MERDLWRRVGEGLRRLPRWWPRNAVYSNRDILAVMLWAALHDRPVSWACRRRNWPVQAWRRALPDQSTMSRRLRDPRILDDLDRVIQAVQRHLPEARMLLTDGKAYALDDRTGDREALVGRVPRGYANGYKLHVIIGACHRLERWAVHPLNHGESTACRELVERMKPTTRRRLMVGDAGYNSNRLFEAAADRGLRLVAPRCKPGTGLGWRRHHRDRVSSMKLTERREGWMWPMLRARRTGVERFFAGLVTTGGGAAHLPSWVRGLRRTRLWIGAKLVVNAARITRNREMLA